MEGRKEIYKIVLFVSLICYVINMQNGFFLLFVICELI